MNNIRMALLQLKVGLDKQININNAIEKIKTVAQNGAKIVCLPECFNSPYDVNAFSDYSEDVVNGSTNTALRNAARDNGVWIFGGSIPELKANGTICNTHTTFNSDGEIVGHFRKMHLFDIDIPGKITFKESSTITAGDSFFNFTVPVNSSDEGLNVGVGICYDIRFPELAQIYSLERNCNLLFYPGAFNTTTGPLHWKALAIARAVDNQCYVVMCSPARNSDASYQAWGHSIIVDPWGNVCAEADEKECLIYGDIDLEIAKNFRRSVPIRGQRRIDLYSIAKTEIN